MRMEKRNMKRNIAKPIAAALALGCLALAAALARESWQAAIGVIWHGALLAGFAVSED